MGTTLHDKITLQQHSQSKMNLETRTKERNSTSLSQFCHTSFILAPYARTNKVLVLLQVLIKLIFSGRK